MTRGGVGLIEELLEVGEIADIRRTPIYRAAVASLAEQTTLLSALPDEAGTVEVITGVRVNTSRRLWSAEQPGLPATGLAGCPPPEPGLLCDRHRVAFPNRRSAWGRSSRRRRLVFMSVIAVGVAAGIILSVAGHSKAGGIAFAFLGVVLAFLNLTTPTGHRDPR